MKNWFAFISSSLIIIGLALFLRESHEQDLPEPSLPSLEEDWTYSQEERATLHSLDSGFPHKELEAIGIFGGVVHVADTTGTIYLLDLHRLAKVPENARWHATSLPEKTSEQLFIVLCADQDWFHSLITRELAEQLCSEGRISMINTDDGQTVLSPHRTANDQIIEQAGLKPPARRNGPVTVIERKSE